MNVNSDYLGKHRKFRIDSKKLATLFIISAFIVSVIVFWWLKLVGITVTGEAFCGQDEHTHSSSCYVSELICGFDEEETESLTDETEFETEETSDENESEETPESSELHETEEPTEVTHEHTAECCVTQLVCEITEHTHTAECFPDKTADVETVGDWLDTIDEVEITNNIPENLVAIALSQVGYEESNNNFEYDNDGNRNG